MVQQEEMFASDLTASKQMLKQLDHLQLTEAEQDELARIVQLHVRPPHIPLSMEMVTQIAAHYERDRARVAALLANPAAPEWLLVVSQVVSFIVAHSRRPPDSETVAQLGRTVFDAIWHDLRSYPFDSSFETWITLRMVCHVGRLRRD